MIRCRAWNLILSVFAGVIQVFPYEDICKDRGYLDSCLNQLPPLISRDGTNGIPSSKKQVDAVCSAFKKGMQCIDLYSDTCLSPGVRQVINENVAGARHTFAFLCDDPLFQSEYLQYAPCYRSVTKDWDFCANRFLKQVTPHNHTGSSTVETCCAKQAFHRCVYEFGNMRCRPDAASFLRRIAETLSNVHVYRMACFPDEKYDVMCAASKCNSSQSLSSISLLLFSLLLSVPSFGFIAESDAANRGCGISDGPLPGRDDDDDDDDDGDASSEC